MAEREGLSGGFIRSAYISEKSAIHGRFTGYTTDYMLDYTVHVLSMPREFHLASGSRIRLGIEIVATGIARRREAPRQHAERATRKRQGSGTAAVQRWRDPISTL